MNVTLKDIANAAGVSVGTVDRALHNRGRIRPEVAQQIIAIANEMDYHINATAQLAIQSKKVHTIVVILHIYQNDFYTDIFAGIQNAKQQLGTRNINIEIYHCNDFDAQDQLNLINTAVETGASAIVIVPINDAVIHQKIAELHQQGFPVLFLSSFLENVPCLTAIHCDYTLSGYTAAGLLRLLSGGTCNALIFVPSLTLTTNQLRLEGFQTAIAANSPGIHIEDIIILPNDSLDSYQIVSKALADHPNVTHIVYNGNARSGLKALQECDHKIHSIFFDMAPPTKTALKEGLIDAVITQSPLEQGRLAITVLFQYLILKKVPAPRMLIDCHIIFKENLIE